MRALPVALDLGADDAPSRLLATLDAHGMSAVDALEIEESHLDVVTLTVLTKLLLPGMLARKRAKIMNVGSTGSFIARAKMSDAHAGHSRRR